MIVTNNAVKKLLDKKGMSLEELYEYKQQLKNTRSILQNYQSFITKFLKRNRTGKILYKYIRTVYGDISVQYSNYDTIFKVSPLSLLDRNLEIKVYSSRTQNFNIDYTLSKYDDNSIKQLLIDFINNDKKSFFIKSHLLRDAQYINYDADLRRNIHLITNKIDDVNVVINEIEINNKLQEGNYIIYTERNCAKIRPYKIWKRTDKTIYLIDTNNIKNKKLVSTIIYDYPKLNFDGDSHWEEMYILTKKELSKLLIKYKLTA